MSTRDLARWVDAGLLSREQADAIIAHEEGRRDTDSRTPILGEALGYLGAALGLAGGIAWLAGSWEDLGEWTRAGILLGGALLAGVAGAALLRSTNRAAQRLLSVLWFVAVVLFLWAGAIVAGDVLDASEGRLLAAGAAALAMGLPLWLLWRRGLQQLAVVGALHLVVQGLLLAAFDAPPLVHGLGVSIVGIAWLVLGWLDRASPRRVAMPLGALSVMFGPVLATGEGDWSLLWGLGTGLGLMTAAVAYREIPVLAIAAVGTFGFLAGTVVSYFGDTLGVPLALALAGLLIVAGAVVAARWGMRQAGGVARSPKVNPGDPR